MEQFFCEHILDEDDFGFTHCPLATSNFDMLYDVKIFFYCWCNVPMLEFVNFFREVCHFVMYLSRTL